MKVLIIILLFIFLFFQSFKCTVSNIYMQPELEVLNLSSTTKFICIKEKDDYRGFEVNLLPNTSSQYIQISINRLNNTATEISVQSFDYIGAFCLICSSTGERNLSTRSDILIGREPGLLMRAKRCIVYYDTYIDCTIIAPIMVQAITNRLPYEIKFLERTLYLGSRNYQLDPKLVETNLINGTLTYRWFPESTVNFPPRLKMVVYAKIHHFGTSNYTMDMTPIYNISSNFTVPFISSTDLKIEFNHGKFSSLSFCHGNLTNEEQIQTSNKEDIRTFDESNEAIYVSDLNPNTWYQICFYCRRDSSMDTISNTECYRYKTLKTSHRLTIRMIIIITSVIICCLSTIILYIIFCRRSNCAWIKGKLSCIPCIKQSEDNELTGIRPTSIDEYIQVQTNYDAHFPRSDIH